MPSMTSFSVEMASISFGVLFSSSLIVPDLLVAYSADPGKRKVSPLKMMVVSFTLSSGNAFPSCIAITRYQVPWNLSKSVLGAAGAGSSRLHAPINRPTAAIISNRNFIVLSKSGLVCAQAQMLQRLPVYFHSQYSECVLPSASTAYSNRTATLFSRDHFGGMV